MMPAGKKRRKKRQNQKVVKLDSLKQLNLNAAGLDIGLAEIWARVPEDRAEMSVRVYEAFTPDLHALADWLTACGIQTVDMESTTHSRRVSAGFGDNFIVEDDDTVRELAHCVLLKYGYTVGPGWHVTAYLRQ